MKRTIIVTGSLGLIGYETTVRLLAAGYRVVGIDNDLRARIFHITTQYSSKLQLLRRRFHGAYRHYDHDIRAREAMEEVFKEEGSGLAGIIHTAAQTSHDWAKKDPDLDFTVNAYATLQLLELYRRYTPKGCFYLHLHQ